MGSSVSCMSACIQSNKQSASSDCMLQDDSSKSSNDSNIVYRLQKNYNLEKDQKIENYWFEQEVENGKLSVVMNFNHPEKEQTEVNEYKEVTITPYRRLDFSLIIDDSYFFSFLSNLSSKSLEVIELRGIDFSASNSEFWKIMKIIADGNCLSFKLFECKIPESNEDIEQPKSPVSNKKECLQNKEVNFFGRLDSLDLSQNKFTYKDCKMISGLLPNAGSIIIKEKKLRTIEVHSGELLRQKSDQN